MPPRVFRALLALLVPALLVLPAQAQTPNYPALPPPTPVAPDTLPSVPTATKQAPSREVGSPSQAPQTQPAQNPVVRQTTPLQSPQQPASPLETPIPVAPNPTTPQQQPYSNPIDQPIPAPGTQPAAQPPSTVNPLEQPVTIQPAQPPQVQPVEIAPPSPVASLPSISTEYPVSEVIAKDHLGSTYIPDDSWIYPEALRLYSMGYLPSAFISMRPWTRRSLLHMLEQSAPSIKDSGDEQAQEIYASLMTYVSAEDPGPTGTLSSAMTRGAVYGFDTAYTRIMGIQGLTLRDSDHLGQTIVNDYGRPYEPGFNNITGFSSVNEWNRFSLYVRGEYQHAPSAAGYSTGLTNFLYAVDGIPFASPHIPDDDYPLGPISAANPFRLDEAYLSFHFWGHEISGGKSDAWLGPGQGGAMAWSNNAENIYSFRINRVEPMHIPYFDKVFGALRYDFFVGSLKGHTYPNDPWVHSEMFSLRPTNNFEFSFQRTVIWGGEGHVPITLHTFFRSFFSFSDTQTDPAAKNSRNDPGARFSSFSFSWRLPFLRTVTLYTDSDTHDDVSPVSAPRRAAYRPGIYISRLPYAPRFDFRAEAASTDCSTLVCQQGNNQYYEGVQRNGYTNKGFIMGDWVGREAIAYQSWLTYHLSGNEWIQASYLHKMTPQDFIQSGVSQSSFKLEAMKRLRPDVELDAWYQFEHWTAPVYQTNQQTDNVFAFQFTFYPKLRDKSPHLNGK